ncbi:MAG: hypothetical protein A2563_02305 [Candidatus Magasanikbacteria bacterium RIFOXYD1_FULL_40_23]|uniref:Uncharacterized protein n=1 Tax=Candidatus Magasanikbacteria bacterium RIFOXYD1_FULL_40_23 TaxID=1798705 RepID=A0A1F6PB68_9BACT|nr:MAG: hypothetical protein A2563_02305 [Candidatus Magasanikbacteria bacterium RIFOXYD1_FULL_40_23]
MFYCFRAWMRSSCPTIKCRGKSKPRNNLCTIDFLPKKEYNILAYLLVGRRKFMGTRTRTRTIGAVQALMGRVLHPCDGCPNTGRSPEFHEEYLKRITKLFVVFFQETGIDLAGEVTARLDMPLGKRSNRLYWHLKFWLASQMPAGSKERAYFTEVDIQEKPKD